METLLKDIQYAARTLRKNTGITLIAVLSLSIGIGANTTIFSFIHTLLLKPLPVSNPKELRIFGEGRRRGNESGPAEGERQLFSWREYQDLRSTDTAFQDLIAIDSNHHRVYANLNTAAREPLLAHLVSGNFFTALGVPAAAGELFNPNADHVRTPHAVISDSFWSRRFHRDPSVIGTQLRIRNRIYTVTGVAAQSFTGTLADQLPDLWIPLSMQGEFPTEDGISLSDAKSHFLHLLGRLKPNVSTAAAQANTNGIYSHLLAAYPGSRPAHITLTDGSRGFSRLRTTYRFPLLVLLFIVAAVLAIACANAANLLMFLGVKRHRELAIRVAVGAGARRLLRQLLIEGLMLSAAAAVVGVCLAKAAGAVLVHLISTGPTPLPFTFEWNLPVLLFTTFAAILTGVAFSLAPALRARRVDVIGSLKQSRSSTATQGALRFGRALVIAQAGVSLALLIASGMLLSTFTRLANTSIGFDKTNVVLLRIDSEASGYKQDSGLTAVYERVTRDIASVPGVISAAAAVRVFNEGGWSEYFKSPGLQLSPTQSLSAINIVSSDFFKTLGVPIVAGRPFNSADNPAAPLVAVVSQSFAKSIFGGQSPIGRILEMAPLTPGDQRFQIVGVVGDAKIRDVRDNETNLIYLPLAQNPIYASDIAVRVAGNIDSTIPALRSALASAAPDLPLRWITNLNSEVADSLVRERAIAQLSGFFALVALLLAAIGLYGAISFAVSARTAEIGIRMALGAQKRGVLTHVIADALKLAGFGILIGLPLALVAGLAMKSLLYGIGSFDAGAAAIAIAVLCAVTLAAGYLPARRAAAVDPITALRYE